uniref:Uncharacterized protein n=1 Tax=Anguilla anguilla TaxID=7936 RepID=A0A0E9WLH5_ANGAN
MFERHCTYKNIFVRNSYTEAPRQCATLVSALNRIDLQRSLYITFRPNPANTCSIQRTVSLQSTATEGGCRRNCGFLSRTTACEILDSA